VPLVVTPDNSDNWTETPHATASAALSGSRTYLGNAMENRPNLYEHLAALARLDYAMGAPQGSLGELRRAGPGPPLPVQPGKGALGVRP